MAAPMWGACTPRKQARPKLTDSDEAAMQLALEFYGPMYLLYSVYDGANDKDSVAPLLGAHIERFIARIESAHRKAGRSI